MTVEAVIEQRLAAVEAAVRDIQRRLPPPAQPDWLAQLIGSQHGEPAFDEVIAYGREYRAANFPPDTESGGDAP